MTYQQNMIDFINRHTIALDRCLPIKDRERAMLAIDLLVRAGQVSEWHHASGLRYWTAANAKPLSDPSLARAFGILMFCHSSASRSLVTKNDLENYFPKLFRHGLPAGHYVDATAQSQRLGNVCVDTGQSRISRIVDRARCSIGKCEQQAGIRELIRRGEFELAWIVPTLPKQRRLTEALQPFDASGIRLKVIAIPDLLNVAAHLPQPNSELN
ncbi:hypothetical protein [Planctomycetes bacterium K23_9]